MDPMDDKTRLGRIVKAWDALFFRDKDDVMQLASDRLRLEGKCLFRLRDAIRGQKSQGYIDIDDWKEA